MTQALVVPYKTPPPDSVKVRDWHDFFSGGARLEDRLMDWAPGTPVQLKRRIAVNVPVILEACGLPTSTTVAVIATGVCKTTSLRLVSAPLILDASSTLTREHTLSLDMDGHDLAGQLSIHTRIVTHQRVSPSPIIPWRPGLVLWEDTTKLALEGEGSRFPMEVCNFEKMNSSRWPSRAMWKLDWDPDDLHGHVLGNIRLFLNSGHPAIKNMLENRTNEASRVTIGLIHYEVGRLMIISALGNESFMENMASYSDDSVGAMLHLLVQSILKTGDSIELVASRLRKDPTQFETELQSRLRILEKVP